MSKSIYLLVGAAAGAAATYLYLNPPVGLPPVSTGDDVSDAFGKATARATSWGAEQRVSGTGNQVLGKVKQGLGDVVGDDKLANEGVFDQAKGAVKDAAGQAAHTAVDAIQELKR